MKHDVYDSAAASAIRDVRSQRGSTETAADENQEIRKRLESASTPGPGHRALDPLVGQWQCGVKCWADPNGEPEQSNATAAVSWIMGGRFIQEDFQGKMMGRAFQGRTLLGFDNVKQAFQSMWVNEMSTAMFTSEGRADGDTITLEGKSSCAATGRAEIPMKLVYRVQSRDKHTFEIYDGSKGFAKTLEIFYTRQ